MDIANKKGLTNENMTEGITERDFNTRMDAARASVAKKPPEPSPTGAAGMRMALRKADAGYRTVTTSACSMIEIVERAKALRQDAVIKPDTLNRLKTDILRLYHNTQGPLLFENLQLVRFDDNYYQYHCVNVALLNAIIGTLMGLEEGELEDLVAVGLVIDIGMLTLPSRILRGSSELSAYDRQQVRNHPQYSVNILEQSGIRDDSLLDAVLHHHERFNGKGYPDSVAGEDIPLYARITSVADSFDAAIARKKYRQNKSAFRVLAEFSENHDASMDPAIIEVATAGLAQMLVGRHVVLSDRSVGKVMDVHPSNVEFPVVRVLGRSIQTGPELYPVSLSSYVPMF